MALLVNPEADVFDGIQVTGYDSARFARFTEQHRMLSADGTALGAPKNRYGAYISALMAKELNLVVGDTAVLTVMRGQHGLPRLRKAPVEGIFQTSLDEFDQGNLLMNIADVRRMAGIRGDSVSAYVVEVKNPEEREILAAYWNALVPYDVQVRSVDERHPAIFGWLKLFDTNIALVLSIVLIVALANLVTALLVLIIDRTQMIGTLKALGGSDRMILRVFQWMSLKILGRGLLWGNGIGLFLSWVQFQFGPVQLDPATYYIATAPITFDWVWILGANAGFLVFAYLVLLLPVRWIARLQPIKSIRFA
jgi:lipoprotein-releasing system permease protein